MKKDTVLITGACVNTGVAIVEKFASKGWNVVFTGRDEDKVNAAENTYRKKFPETDVSGYVLKALLPNGAVNVEGIEKMFEDLDKKNIFIKCMVLNASNQGIGQKIFENSLAEFSKVINTNMIWNYALIEFAGRRMKDRNGGSIVFINSNTAYRAIPDRIAYTASKSGQLGMMRALALDLGKYNIRINAVLPGMIKTDRWEKNPHWYENVPSAFTPLGDVAVGEDIAEGVWYFAEHARNTTGAELTIDGGNMIQLYPIVPGERK